MCLERPSHVVLTMLAAVQVDRIPAWIRHSRDQPVLDQEQKRKPAPLDQIHTSYNSLENRTPVLAVYSLLVRLDHLLIP